MPLVRFFAVVGGFLLAMLFVVNWYLPDAAPMARYGTPIDEAILRIRSDHKWPKKVVFDTSIPTIVAPAAPPLSRQQRRQVRRKVQRSTLLLSRGRRSPRLSRSTSNVSATPGFRAPKLRCVSRSIRRRPFGQRVGNIPDEHWRRSYVLMNTSKMIASAIIARPVLATSRAAKAVAPMPTVFLLLIAG